MTRIEAEKIYRSTVKRLLAFVYVNFLTSWDTETEAPAGAMELEGRQFSTLAEIEYEIQTAPEFCEAVEQLYEERESLDPVLKHEIQEQHKEIDKMKRIPKEEFAAYRELLAKAYPAYVDAKQNNKYEDFAPVLEKIVEYNRRLMGWLEKEDRKGYDVLLDMYEPGSTQKEYDEFFDLLKKEIVPLAQQVDKIDLPYDFGFGELEYDVERQKQFCEYMRDVMCVDRNYSIMMESEHPFTTGFGTDDIRITNHYYPNAFVSSIFSAIHESGHGLYMAQCDKALNDTLSGDGASMAMHESQSRFYENMIGRSPAFWEAHYGKLKETFPEQLKGVSEEAFVHFINQAKFSFIRTEADELTYPLHIMLRYDIEKKLMEGDLHVNELPSYWNSLFKEYFGLVPETDSDGVLQDVHWASGDFGYFPTYALGSAYAAQFYHKMSSDFDIDQALRSGTTEEINRWLKEKVHRFGASKYPKEILEYATGETFNPRYYVDYLTEKYTKLYKL